MKEKFQDMSFKDAESYLESFDFSIENAYSENPNKKTQTPADLRETFEKEGYNWISNFSNDEAEIIEDVCKKEGIDYRRGSAFTKDGQYISSMSSIFLPEGASMSKICQELSAPEREGYFPKKQYSGSLDEVLVIQTHEWGVTDGTKKKSVIATDCIDTCMVLVGYEPSKHTGFLVHLTETSDAPSTLGNLERDLDDKNNYQLRILGGTSKGQKPRAKQLMQLFGDSEGVNGEFVEKDLYGLNSLRSIALDTKTGRVYGFKDLAPIETHNAQFGLYGTPAVRVSNE
ncbi:MAG: hypothetical protein KAU95_02540 [Candidatus Aenigmarchaeota archaeon]|nr:hypothetical protein [Candidatus Aenigmarchaeota archaeon]